MSIKKSSWDTLSDCRVGRLSTSTARDNILWKMDTSLGGTQTHTHVERERELRLARGKAPLCVVHARLALTGDPRVILNQPDVSVSLAGRFFALCRLPDGRIQPLEQVPAKSRRRREHTFVKRAELRCVALPAHLT